MILFAITNNIGTPICYGLASTKPMIEKTFGHLDRKVEVPTKTFMEKTKPDNLCKNEEVTVMSRGKKSIESP